MSKKYLIIFGIIVILIVGIFVFIPLENTKTKYKKIDTVLAVPINSEIMIHISDFNRFIKKNAENSICNELFSWQSLKVLKTEIFNAFKILGEDDFSDLVSGSQLTIATKMSGRRNIEYSYIFPLQNETNKGHILKVFGRRFANFKTKKRIYSGFELFQTIGENEEYYYTFAKGLLIFSTSQIPIEDAILQINSGKSLLAKKSFRKLQKMVSANDDLNIFINGDTSPAMFSLGVAREYKEFVKKLTTFSEEVSLGLSFADDKILVNGFFYTGTDEFNYMNILLTQQPKENSLEKIIPSDTKFMGAIVLSDKDSYMDKYIRYMERTGDIRKYRDFAKVFYAQTGEYPDEFIYPQLKGEIALAIRENKETGKSAEHYCIVRVNNQEETAHRFEELLTRYCKKGNKLAEYNTYHIDKKLSYNLYKFPYSDFAKVLWGGLFLNTETNYYSIVGDYLIFASTEDGLKKYLDQISKARVLANNKEFQQQKKFWGENKASFIAYLENTSQRDFITNITNPKVAEIINRKSDILDKFPYVGVQLRAVQEMVHIDGYISYQKQYEKQLQVAWQTRIGSSLNVVPNIVKNHNTKETEIIFQDKNNALCLMDKRGKILWKKELKEKILGKIHQVDAFKNAKLQYLFNTKSSLYMIDRNGNIVTGFPRKLLSLATNPIAVFDYNKNRNYRICVAGKDKKIYMYDIKANRVKGWKTPSTQKCVLEIIQRVVCGGKDYIICNDGGQNYLFNRRGEVRKTPNKQYRRAKYSITSIARKTPLQECKIINTDSNGLIHSTLMDGKVYTKSVGSFSSDHIFLSADIDTDGRNDYIFVDGKTLSVINHAGQLLFDYEFEDTVVDSPVIYSFSANDKKIGVWAGDKIYLFSSNGRLYNGFPLEGYAPFAIDFSATKEKNISLFVAGKGNLIYNYSEQ